MKLSEKKLISILKNNHRISNSQTTTHCPVSFDKSSLYLPLTNRFHQIYKQISSKSLISKEKVFHQQLLSEIQDLINEKRKKLEQLHKKVHKKQINVTQNFLHPTYSSRVKLAPFADLLSNKQNNKMQLKQKSLGQIQTSLSKQLSIDQETKKVKFLSPLDFIQRQQKPFEEYNRANILDYQKRMQENSKRYEQNQQDIFGLLNKLQMADKCSKYKVAAQLLRIQKRN